MESGSTSIYHKYTTNSRIHCLLKIGFFCFFHRDPFFDSEILGGLASYHGETQNGKTLMVSMVRVRFPTVPKKGRFVCMLNCLLVGNNFDLVNREANYQVLQPWD